MDEKTSCLSDRKVRKKNQISEYYVPSPKKYNEKDTKSIDKKSPKLVGVLKRKTERLIKYNW